MSTLVTTTGDNLAINGVRLVLYTDKQLFMVWIHSMTVQTGIGSYSEAQALLVI